MERNRFRPRSIDRWVFAILSVLHIANGLYLIGPWYLEESESGKRPLANLFNNDLAVSVFGLLILIDGLVLLYAATSKGHHRIYTRLVSGALLTGFLLRLYSLIGVLLVIQSWRPPSYLSQTAAVAILGAYWLWVRVHARPTE